MRAPIKFIRTITRARIMSLMILVAFSSLVIWSTKRVAEFYRFRPVRAHRLQKAAEHGAHCQILEKILTHSTHPDFVSWNAATLRYHKDLEQKYRKGAAEPWVVLQPDPPKPASPLDQAIRDKNALRMRTARLLRKFEKLEPENNPIEEQQDPPETASPLDSNSFKRRLHALEKRRDELMKELEIRRSHPKPGNNSGRVKPDYL